MNDRITLKGFFKTLESDQGLVRCQNDIYRKIQIYNDTK